MEILSHYKTFKPTFTVGVGGYASGPLNYMASKMSVPVYLQEQNSYPGITNKLLKNVAQKICVAYDGMEQFFPAQKIVLTGNPIRQDLLADTADQNEARDYFRLAKDKKNRFSSRRKSWSTHDKRSDNG